jgi:hypothetical protein
MAIPEPIRNLTTCELNKPFELLSLKHEIPVLFQSLSGPVRESPDWLKMPLLPGSQNEWRLRCL